MNVISSNSILVSISILHFQEKPFCMYKRDYKVRVGNDRFEGFAVDLIREVADMLKFNYDIYLVNDGLFGSRTKDGSWNGMIGELLSGVCCVQSYTQGYVAFRATLRAMLCSELHAGLCCVQSYTQGYVVFRATLRGMLCSELLLGVDW